MICVTVKMSSHKYLTLNAFQSNTGFIDIIVRSKENAAIFQFHKKKAINVYLWRQFWVYQTKSAV